MKVAPPRFGLWGSKKHRNKTINKEAQVAPRFADEFAHDIWVKVLLAVTDPLIQSILFTAKVDYLEKGKVFAILFPTKQRDFSETLKNSFEVWGKPFHNIEGIDKVAVMFDGEEGV